MLYRQHSLLVFGQLHGDSREWIRNGTFADALQLGGNALPTRQGGFGTVGRRGGLAGSLGVDAVWLHAGLTGGFGVGANRLDFKH